MVDLNFKFCPQDEFSICLGFLLTFQCFAYLAAFFLGAFSLSYCILFTEYIVGQLELITCYVSQLNLTDTQDLRAKFEEIIKIHLDVLRVTNQYSYLNTISIKLRELFLFGAIPLTIFGKDQEQLLLLSSCMFPICLLGLFNYNAERIMSTEEETRKAYYEMEWYQAPVKNRKLLLLAMQQPKEIKISGLFNYDQASLIRFTEAVRRAYDFGLFLLKIAKN